MVIHTGGKKRQPTHAAPVKSDRGNGPAQFKSKDVPQFAPNFSVYVLPPDAVCLYSEDRKFFLHGELYCALAAAIGAGKSVGQIERELQKTFPADKIHEALGRLVQRHYIIPKLPPAAATNAAYWASLGLPPDVAEKNLKQCRVRIQAIDVNGAKELGTALTKLGVRVVKGAADLTVVLVNDYLEARLDREQTSGICPMARPGCWCSPPAFSRWSGPVFAPGESACWTCLAHRMQRNREVKTLLDWRQARCVAPSPLARKRDSGRTALRSPPSRLRGRSPPAFAPSCAITSSASTCSARPSPSITWPADRNARPAAIRN